MGPCLQGVGGLGLQNLIEDFLHKLSQAIMTAKET